MKKIGIVFVALFCINNMILAQDGQKLKYFKSDNAFYLGNTRLSDNEIESVLSKNSLALEAWNKGNSNKTANTVMKISTGVLLVSGGVISIVSFSVAVALLPYAIFGGVDTDAGQWLTAGIILFSAGVITGIMIPITKSNYQYHYSDAVGIYNNGLKTKNTVSLHIGAVGNGFGVSLKF